MDEEWQPDAIIELKIGVVKKKELYDYVEKNPEKIDSNISIGAMPVVRQYCNNTTIHWNRTITG